VWLADRVRFGHALDRLEAMLDPAERGRAGRFRFESDRAVFVLGRGWLRFLLGRLTGVRPDAVSLAVAEHGKPFLPVGPGGPAPAFNLSHSGDLALIAVAAGGRLGVDVERIDPDRDVDPIADRFFSAREAATLAVLAPSLRRRAFYACWTRKEAYLKALGRGLSIPLKSFSVSLDPGEAPELLESDGGVGGWWLEDVSPSPSFAAALAGDTRRPRVRLFAAAASLLES
jgi:4'-phosphopantetheinyl transferase